jgi:hypothetical protein
MTFGKFDDRTLATVLAALRWYQQALAQQRVPEAIDAIATNLGQCRRLTSRQIDAICDQLNRNGATVQAIVQVAGGVVQDIIADVPNLEVVLVDYDNIAQGDKPGAYAVTVDKDFIRKHFRKLAAGQLPSALRR